MDTVQSSEKYHQRWLEKQRAEAAAAREAAVERDVALIVAWDRDHVRWDDMPVDIIREWVAQRHDAGEARL